MLVNETCSCGREFTKEDFEIQIVKFAVGSQSRHVAVCSPECAAQVSALSWSAPRGKQ